MCQLAERKAHKNVCKMVLSGGSEPVAEMVCGHKIHMKCYRKLFDKKHTVTGPKGKTAVETKELPTASCPLCRRDVQETPRTGGGK